MKKYIAGMFLVASIMAIGTFGINKAQAQTITFQQLIELFINLGVIAPDKANAARVAVGLDPVYATTTESVATSTGSTESGISQGVTNVDNTNTTASSLPTDTQVQSSGIIVNPPNMPTLSLGDGYFDSKGTWIVPVVMSAGSYARVYFDAENSQAHSSVKFTFTPYSYQVARNGLDMINFSSGAIPDSTGDFNWTAIVYDGIGNVITTSSGTFTVPSN